MGHPNAFAVGVYPAATRTANSLAVSSRDALLTAIVLSAGIALFILVPIYLRAKRRRYIRSRIRITYDSRRNPSPPVRKLYSVGNTSRITPRRPGNASPYLEKVKSSRWTEPRTVGHS
jgi:hypothetical protein